MTYYGGPELAKAFRTVRNNTIKIAEEIPEDKYDFRAAPETRTVAQTLLHIMTAPRMSYEMHGKLQLTTFEGFDYMAVFGPLMAEEQKPHTKAEILARLRAEGEQIANWLESVPESFLAGMISFPANFNQPPKSRFEMLLSLKEHEMHHRGQLMVLQRMMGLKPHLTREMEARMAAMQQSTAKA